MKKYILLLLAIGCVILLKAQPNPQLSVIPVNEVYEKIKVGENVKIILTQWPGNGIVSKGESEADITVKAGVLSVNKKACCKKGVITVSLPVRQIKSIELNEGSSAYTEAPLQSATLTVYVTGVSYFELKSTGMINVVYDEGLELDIKKVKNEKLFKAAAGK